MSFTYDRATRASSPARQPVGLRASGGAAAEARAARAARAAQAWEVARGLAVADAGCGGAVVMRATGAAAAVRAKAVDRAALAGRWEVEGVVCAARRAMAMWVAGQEGGAATEGGPRRGRRGRLSMGARREL